MNERQVRLELLQSVAKSQAAIARILHAIADVTEGSPAMASKIRDNIRIMSDMQLSMLRLAAHGRIRLIRYGCPADPWLNRQVVNGFSARKRNCTKYRTRWRSR
jgi:hypothetical protein